MSPRYMVFAGVGLAVVMMVLMAVGTYNMGMFITWGVLAGVGLAIAALGHRLEQREVETRLEAERRGD